MVSDSVSDTVCFDIDPNAAFMPPLRAWLIQSQLAIEQTAPSRKVRLSAYNRSLSMPAISSRADTSAAADMSLSPAVNAAPAPNAEERRLFSLRGGARAKQFALRLMANALWMKQFLHGGK